MSFRLTRILSWIESSDVFYVFIEVNFINRTLYLNDYKSVASSQCRWSYMFYDAWSIAHSLLTSRCNRHYFHLEGINHAMKTIQELSSAPIYDSYNSTYNPSHGLRKGERDGRNL